MNNHSMPDHERAQAEAARGFMPVDEGLALYASAQPAGWEHHEADLVDPEIGKMDTLPIFRRTVYDAGLEGTVIGLVGDSTTIASHWNTPLALLFIDGGHGSEPAHADYEHWVPHVAVDGLLLIHDVFPDPADGGRPPFEIWTRAMESGAFEELDVTGSLRTLRRIGEGL